MITTIKSDSTVAIIQLAKLGPTDVVFSTLWIQNLTEIALSVTVCEMSFSISAKIQDDRKKNQKSLNFSEVL